MRAFAGQPGDPASFRRLHRLLEAQAYRLAYLARRRRGDQLPPLFQHQRPRRAAHRIAGAVRGDAPAGLRHGRARARCRACASTISTGCSTRRGIARRCAGAPAIDSTSSSRRSWRATSACRTGRSPARTGYDFVNQVLGDFCRSRRRGGDDPPLSPDHRAARGFRRGPVRREAAHHAGQSGERDERAGAPLSPPVDARLAHPRLHLATAC